MQMIGQMKAGDSGHNKQQSTGEKKRVDKEKQTRQKWMDKEGDNNEQAESQSKAQISIYTYNEKNHYSKTGAESVAKGVETYGHMSTLNMNKKTAATMSSKQAF